MLAVVGIGTAYFEHHAVVARQHRHVIAVAAHVDVLEPSGFWVVASVQTVCYRTVFQQGCCLTGEAIREGPLTTSRTYQQASVRVASFDFRFILRCAADFSVPIIRSLDIVMDSKATFYITLMQYITDNGSRNAPNI